MKHKSPDYKLSAINYYLNHDVGYDNTCKIFEIGQTLYDANTSENEIIDLLEGYGYIINKSISANDYLFYLP